jgi:hypothetical protein
VGSGGAGLIGWTPPSSASPYYPIVTGNPGHDMAVQLVDMMHYINQNGGLGPLNAAGARGGPMAAAWLFSAQYERPAVTGSDIRPVIVDILYGAGLAEGGMVGRGPSGMTQLPVQAFDSGGWLHPGMTLAVNNTGRAEPVGIQGGGTDMSHVEALLGAILDELSALNANSAPDSHAQALRRAFGGAARGGATAGLTSTRGVAAW